MAALVGIDPDSDGRQQAEAGAERDSAAEALWRQEQELLDEMHEIAETHRHHPDAKTRYLIDQNNAISGACA